MPQELCFVAGYISLMRRLTGIGVREERRSGVSSVDVSRETPCGMSSTNVFSLCRRSGISTIGVASSAGLSVSGDLNASDYVTASYVQASLAGVSCFSSTAPLGLSSRYTTLECLLLLHPYSCIPRFLTINFHSNVITLLQVRQGSCSYELFNWLIMFLCMLLKCHSVLNVVNFWAEVAIKFTEDSVIIMLFDFCQCERFHYCICFTSHWHCAYSNELT